MSAISHPSNLMDRSQIRPSDVDRFAAKVSTDASTDCLIWCGSLDRHGYGRFHLFGRRGGTTGAHRFAYVLANVFIRPEYVIDHLCQNRRCVNADHLQAVPNPENTARGRAGQFNRSKTHCPSGHPYSGENLIIEVRSGHQRRTCRECRRAATRRSRARQRARHGEPAAA